MNTERRMVMEMITTPNGIEYITDNQDAVELVRKYISDDMADYVENKIVEFDEVEWRNAQEWASDYRAMEMENEEWRNELDEINSKLQQITYQADKQPGMSKRKILNELDLIIDHIQKLL